MSIYPCVSIKPVLSVGILLRDVTIFFTLDTCKPLNIILRMQMMRKRKLYVKTLLWSVALLFLAVATFENFHTCSSCPCCSTSLNGDQGKCPYWCDCDHPAAIQNDSSRQPIPEKGQCPGCGKDKNPNLQALTRIVLPVETFMTSNEAVEIDLPCVNRQPGEILRGPPGR